MRSRKPLISRYISVTADFREKCHKNRANTLKDRDLIEKKSDSDSEIIQIQIGLVLNSASEPVCLEPNPNSNSAWARLSAELAELAQVGSNLLKWEVTCSSLSVASRVTFEMRNRDMMTSAQPRF